MVVLVLVLRQCFLFILDVVFMGRLTPTFLLLSLALLFWGGVTSLSTHLSTPEQRKSAPNLPPELSAMEKRLESDPQNIDLKFELADKLRAQGTPENGMLMKALQLYSQILETRAEDARALLGLAEISFENGVIDKARGFYERYVVQHPEDLKASTDLGLAQLQMGDGAAAVNTLQGILKRDAKFFPAKLALALAFEVQGNKKQAQTTGEEALKLAPDDNAKNIVQQFLARLSQPTTTPQQASQTVSPASVLTDAVREHQIIGPKVRKIAWVGANEAHVTLGDFPVAQMPAFAKERLRATLAQKLSLSPEALTLKLFEENSETPFLEVSGGGTGKGQQQ